MSVSVLDGLKVCLPVMVGIDIIASTWWNGDPVPLTQHGTVCEDWRDAAKVLVSKEDYAELKNHLNGEV